jgi:hypothetical protein
VLLKSDDFVRAAAQQKLHTVNSGDYSVAPDVASDFVRELYERGFVSRTAGRNIYDTIMSRSPHGMCPMCGYGEVRNLDHYLPKSSFPALCITVENLIPVCIDCNFRKNAVVADDERSLPFHPYFDLFDDVSWLKAQLIQGNVPVVRFAVDPPDAWTAVDRARVLNHFLMFDLGHRYSIQATRILGGIGRQLTSIGRALGSSGVHDHLQELADSFKADRINGFEGATYQAMADSHWLCEGGYGNL